MSNPSKVFDHSLCYVIILQVNYLGVPVSYLYRCRLWYRSSNHVTLIAISRYLHQVGSVCGHTKPSTQLCLTLPAPRLQASSASFIHASSRQEHPLLATCSYTKLFLHLPGPGLRCRSLRMNQSGRYLDCLAHPSTPYVWRVQTTMPAKDPLLFGHPCV
jgi:hypothetical protein